MKKEREINVVVNFTEGWEERFAKAAYDLYLMVEARKSAQNEKECFKPTYSN